MSLTLWIVLGISVLAVIGFVGVMRAQLRQNRDIDSRIDYSKIKPLDEDDEDDEEKELKERWGK